MRRGYQNLPASLRGYTSSIRRPLILPGTEHQREHEVYVQHMAALNPGTSSASIFDHGIEMMQLDPFRQFGPFFFTQTDHIELLHNHPSQLWPAAYWEATYHACALR